MNTVDYKPFAFDVGADVEPQAQFLLDLANPAELKNGYVTGVAKSGQFNKVARQSSVMTAALANAVSQVLAVDVLDDGDVPGLTAKLIAMIIAAAAPASTGDLKLTLKTAADAGWVMCNDGTIGNGASGATYANANAAALFTLLWTNFTNALCPVLPAGRGGSAAADFAANKTIGLTKMLGRALAISGAGAGLTARVLGSTVGEETHQLTVNELAIHAHGLSGVTTESAGAHTHNVSAGQQQVGPDNIAHGTIGADEVFPTSVNGAHTHTFTGNVDNNGGDQPHNNMQPTSFVNVMVKL